MRTILFGLFMFFFCLFGPLLWLIGLVVRIFGRRAFDVYYFHLLRFACRAGRFLSASKIVLEGGDNLPKKDEAVVYVLNHRSIYDIILTYTLLPGPTGFIAKKELGKIPFFSWWLSLGNCLFLDRQDIRKGMKTMLEGIEKVKRGVSMAIFPEGTRNRDKESKTSLLEFHEASFKLATKPDVPIIPVAIYNSADCFENHKPWIRKNTVYITIGKPFKASDLSKEERKFIGRYTREWMQEQLLKSEARHEQG